MLALFVYIPALIAVALVGHWIAALAVWALWFCANMTTVVNGITIRQQLTPDDLQGR